ncbi:hypothetical protein [Pedobacter ureilyticus]|uniref:Uncharacterized protein n=1 Tax=Pedobacter ureilyticus TaxID=1393051 RepID=A0ABW9J717_9SPHI|nr:hypothetical protein [Pedobacter helvus]
MKKLTGKWFSLFNLCATLFLSACKGDGIIERNEEPLSSAYTGFQELNENYRSADFEVKLVAETNSYPHPIRVYPSINNQYIIEADAKTSDETRGDYNFYKINSDGNLTDSLFVPNKGYWAEFIDDFMVFTSYDEAYYTTWPLNGDTTKQDFKVLNADFSWSDIKVKQQIEDAKANAKYWFFKDERDNGNNYMKLHFYQNQQWQILWQKVNGYQTTPDNESAGRYCVEVMRTGETDPYLAKNITYLHQHRLEKIKYSHNIGGGSPGFDVTNWRGKVFFKTKINGKDFQFFQPNIAVENEQFDGNINRFYSISAPNSSANIFTPLFYNTTNSYAFYTSDRNKLYLIRDKKASK